MCQYWNALPPPESTSTQSGVTIRATPDRTGYTSVPSGAETSIPWWYEQAQRLVIRPRIVGLPRKIERGSAKLPRTGCWRPDGLTGRPQAAAGVSAGRHDAPGGERGGGGWCWRGGPPSTGPAP